MFFHILSKNDLVIECDISDFVNYPSIFTYMTILKHKYVALNNKCQIPIKSKLLAILQFSYFNYIILKLYGNISINNWGK